MDSLIEKIKSFEWCWHIEHDIRRYDYWDEKLQEIGKVIKIKKITRLITHFLFIGETIDLIRIPAFFEFDNEGTGFEMFYKDSHTGAKWYMKKKKLGGDNMPRCPKCGKEIDHLKDFSPVWQEYKMTIDENSDAHYEFVDDSLPIDSMNDEYQCPECEEVLFTYADDAIKFLRGETLTKGE
ncbi:hypothetical protein DRN97_02350 [Methanosarcinales archaeon]|nr:MAG: hypothetical protein DRN97_02350 [Methanosarcinales archaeon]